MGKQGDEKEMKRCKAKTKLGRGCRFNAALAGYCMMHYRGKKNETKD